MLVYLTINPILANTKISFQIRKVYILEIEVNKLFCTDLILNFNFTPNRHVIQEAIELLIQKIVCQTSCIITLNDNVELSNYHLTCLSCEIVKIIISLDLFRSFIFYNDKDIANFCATLYQLHANVILVIE